MLPLRIKMSFNDRMTIVGTVGAIAALAIAYLTYKQQFGYSQSPIRFVRAEYSSPRVFQALQKQTMFDTQMTGLDTLHDMIRLNPAVVVELMTNRPIETLRLEVTPVEGMIDFTKNPDQFDTKPTPWILEGIAAKDYPVTFGARKGELIRIPVADLLIRLMAQAQVKEPKNRCLPHYGKYLVKVLAKPAGSPTWTEEAENKGLFFVFFWTPTGFPEVECEDFTKKFLQPLLIIND